MRSLLCKALHLSQNPNFPVSQEAQVRPKSLRGFFLPEFFFILVLPGAHRLHDYALTKMSSQEGQIDTPYLTEYDAMGGIEFELLEEYSDIEMFHTKTEQRFMSVLKDIGINDAVTPAGFPQLYF